jgi:hypothetical protein
MALAVAGAALLRVLAPTRAPFPVGEVAVHAAVLLSLLALSPRLRETLATLPEAHTFPLGAMFLLMFVAQFFGRSSATFPFAVWRMYGSVDTTRVSHIHRVIVRSDDGTAVPVDPDRLFPSVVNWALIGRLDEAAERGDAAALNALTAAYLARYNEEHPSEPAATLAVERCQARIFPRGEATCAEVSVASDGGGP